MIKPAPVCGTGCREESWQAVLAAGAQCRAFSESQLGFCRGGEAGGWVVEGFFCLFNFFWPLNKTSTIPLFCVGLYGAVDSLIKTTLAFACSVVGCGHLPGGDGGAVSVQEAAEQSEGCADPGCSDPRVSTEAVSRCEPQAESGFAGGGRGQWRSPAANR